MLFLKDLVLGSGDLMKMLSNSKIVEFVILSQSLLQSL